MGFQVRCEANGKDFEADLQKKTFSSSSNKSCNFYGGTYYEAESTFVKQLSFSTWNKNFFFYFSQFQ